MTCRFCLITPLSSICTKTSRAANHKRNNKRKMTAGQVAFTPLDAHLPATFDHHLENAMEALMSQLTLKHYRFSALPDIEVFSEPHNTQKHV